MSGFHENISYANAVAGQQPGRPEVCPQTPIDIDHGVAYEFREQETDNYYEKAIRKILSELESKHFFNTEAKTDEEIFNSATNFYSQMTWLSQKKSFFKEIYAKQITLESQLPSYFTLENRQDEQRFYLIFRVLKSFTIYKNYSCYYLEYKPKQDKHSQIKKKINDSTINLHSWRCILYALLVYAYSKSKLHANFRPHSRAQDLRLNNTTNLRENHGLSLSRSLNFSIYQNLFSRTLIQGRDPEYPTFDVNLVNFNDELNNFRGENFLTYFEFMRNFREHYETSRERQNSFAKNHLPANLNISETFKLFNFLPRAYPFLLCLMKLLCPKNHDIHLYLTECNLTDEYYSDPYIYEIDDFVEYIKAIFVVLFQINRDKLSKDLDNVLRNDWNKAFKSS